MAKRPKSVRTDQNKEKSAVDETLNDANDRRSLPSLSDYDLARADGNNGPYVAQERQLSPANLYPSPGLLAEYKALDPAICDEIINGVRAQREHRHSMEKLATTQAVDRQNRADLTQNICAISSIIVSGALVYAQIWFKQDIQWVFPSILVAVGVGGRPVVTSIAAHFLKNHASR
jgi:uncharacterized membrane protein